MCQGRIYVNLYLFRFSEVWLQDLKYVGLFDPKVKLETVYPWTVEQFYGENERISLNFHSNPMLIPALS